MTPRERFLETILFGRPDKIPFEPGWPRESTLAAWRGQGMPAEGDWWGHFLRAVGLEMPAEPPSPPRPEADFRMIPHFEEKVIERRESTLVVQDWKGNICEISDRFDVRYLREAIDFVTRRWIKCPVESRSDWEQMKTRYDLAAPGRFAQDFAQASAAVAQRGHIIAYSINGPFWQLREWLGFEALCMLLLDEPQWMEEMIAFWRDFVSAMLERMFRHLRPDVLHINEDMAYKEKSMISPAMARRFLLPTWKQWCGQAHAAGVTVMDMDSDGFVGELIPLWIEAGFQVCDPIEVAAGNDINQFRRQFGHKMAFRQGIDKRAMAKGGAVMAAELDRIAPVVADGGFIPGCDHGVPSDVRWPHYVEYGKRLARMTRWL